MATNQAAVLADIRAYATAQQRAAAASSAGDQTWERKQDLAGGKYAIKAAALVRTQSKLNRRAVAALRAASVKLTATKAQMAKIVAAAEEGKLPAGLKPLLHQLRAGSDEKAAWAEAIAGATPSPTDVLAELSSPGIETGLVKLELGSPSGRPRPQAEGRCAALRPRSVMALPGTNLTSARLASPTRHGSAGADTPHASLLQRKSESPSGRRQACRLDYPCVAARNESCPRYFFQGCPDPRVRSRPRSRECGAVSCPSSCAR